MFNILKKNVLLKNYEKFCTIKFYFRLCFKIKIQQKKKEKNNDKLMYIQGIYINLGAIIMNIIYYIIIMNNSFFTIII